MNRVSFGGASPRARALRGVVLGTLATFVSLAAHAASVATVDINKFMFMPMEITVAPGTTVRWINHDETPHTVISRDKTKLFVSKAMDTDDKFEFVFAKEGDYTYVCSVHPFMTGVVHVRKQ
ncbi:Amicyanin precursor [Variovorax sp. SRS16]|uniref:cupredoxin domain-containing protein n=1 Tax=Variovorax sp. SRS16 TaxID=282217 RepID=UPI001317465B|nr:cupredoxin family copper-binding protein [Variovorax sp. SRS16]VTU32245.1 Amicyanin precursor [Variovorax sp. SRS16]